MQLSYHLDLLFLYLLLILYFLFCGVLKPMIEQFRITEYLREQKVQQTPQLVEIILEGRAS